MNVGKFILKAIQPYKIYLLGMFIAVCVVSIESNIKPYLVKLMIDTATEATNHNLILLITIFSVLQIIMIGAWALSDFCLVTYTSNFKTYVNSLLIRHINLYPYSFFQDHLSGSVVSKINDVFNNIPSIIFIAIHQFIGFILTISITLYLLWKINFMFAFIMMLWITIFLIITKYGLNKARPLTADYAESKSKIGGYLADYLTNILNIKFFARADYEFKCLEKINNQFINKAHKQGYFLMNFYIIQGIVLSIYTIGFMILLIYFHTNKLISPGDFALVFMLNLGAFERLHSLSHQLRNFITNFEVIDHALKLLDFPLEIQDKLNSKPLIVTKGEIVFEKVKFSYRNKENLFENKSINISSGEKVGLVGYSGSGKSTFVNLILRLFDVTSGRILIDGQDIRKVTLDSLRKKIGMIPQDPTLFHRSLMENILYGRQNATHEEVIKAAKRAHAHEFIEKLPHKYETLVGERGVKLSGGQRQRIAIARAILKNAPILILDEATSNLDSITEKYIQESLWNLMQDKTTIIVAHRLSTLLHMDRILVFDKGKIVQDGNHKELLKRKGLYKTLWDAQIGGFLPESRDSVDHG